jgi:hypothetical protein
MIVQMESESCFFDIYACLLKEIILWRCILLCMYILRRRFFYTTTSTGLNFAKLTQQMHPDLTHHQNQRFGSLDNSSLPYSLKSNYQYYLNYLSSLPCDPTAPYLPLDLTIPLVLSLTHNDVVDPTPHHRPSPVTPTSPPLTRAAVGNSPCAITAIDPSPSPFQDCSISTSYNYKKTSIMHVCYC